MIPRTRLTRVRRSVAVLSTIGLLASAMVAGGVVGATPSWTMDVVELPATVAPGELAGYRVEITNTGSANIAQVYLMADAVPAAPGVPLLTAYLVKSQGKCDPVGQKLSCALGAIKAGKSATVTVAYATPSSGGGLEVAFEANTTGVAGDAPGSSHGDSLMGIGTTSTDASPDFGGRFVTNGSQTVATASGVNSGNQQSTSVASPKVGIGVTVRDGTRDLEFCPTCWSETSEIHIGDGTGIYPAGFKVVLTIYKDLAQPVRGVYHEFDHARFDANGNLISGETIEAQCPKRGTLLPCFTAKNLPGGNTEVTVWLNENGKVGSF